MIGKGAPTIGKSPTTIAILTNTYKKRAEEKPKQYNLAKKLFDKNPIFIIL